MAVVINEPDTSKGWSFGGGGYVSAPVLHDVMEGALRLMDVPPDDIDAWLAAQAAAEARARGGKKPVATFANVIDDADEPGNDDVQAVTP
jgi:cell division protein FtsI (penicillin-binding protein 3)